MMSTLTASVSYRVNQLAVICDIIHYRNPHVRYGTRRFFTALHAFHCRRRAERRLVYAAKRFLCFRWFIQVIRRVALLLH